MHILYVNLYLKIEGSNGNKSVFMYTSLVNNFSSNSLSLIMGLLLASEVLFTIHLSAINMHCFTQPSLGNNGGIHDQ